LPFGAGQHPYFTVGTAFVDDVVLHVPSSTRLELDSQRRLPIGRVMPAADRDFSQPAAIGPRHLDECYCDLERGADGCVRTSLSNPQNGRTLTVWADQHYRYVQVFSGDTLAPERQRRGLAVEPMTCPPNAFRTHTDLIVLEPDEAIEIAWGVDLTHL
jgi:aldose 1-epimerase